MQENALRVRLSGIANKTVYKQPFINEASKKGWTINYKAMQVKIIYYKKIIIYYVIKNLYY